MTEGQMLTPAQLQQQAREALRETGRTQSDAARALDVSRATISKALNDEGDASRYARVLRGIVEEYTAFTVSDEPHYRVNEKAEE